VIFLNIEAGKRLSAQIAKVLSGLPYEKAKMVKEGIYTSTNVVKNHFFKPGMPSEKANNPKLI